MRNYVACIKKSDLFCASKAVALINTDAQSLSCFDGKLSKTECADLHTLALFGGKVEDRQLLSYIHSEQRNIFKVLLEKQKANIGALSLQDTSSYAD